MGVTVKRDFDSFVDSSAGPDECWPWTGYVSSRGYGRWLDGYAHRTAFERAGTSLLPGRKITHTCGMKICCNPKHLQQRRATGAARSGKVRQAYCIRGHPFNDENTYYWNGQRACKICRRIRSKKDYRKRKDGRK